MTTDTDGEKESSAEVNSRKSSFQASELNIDTADIDKKDGSAIVLQGPGILQMQQQQGTMVSWERFLHVRSIRVLLVENDKSTRHVVTALLRNCNYEVLEASNGLQAWKILEDLTNHIDLVLTEVVMPCLSGIALLCKITSHKTRKNIPVIMMSSHDSMNLVFMCLSKGAVDFLLKPIRKNELKNLWQHVWRRCHSSSGSGSESATHTQKSVKPKGIKKPDDTESDDEENNESNGLNVGDESDDESGVQSSWTKQAVEVDSSQATSPKEQIAESPDSTCAHVIRSEGQEQKQPDTVAKGQDLDTTIVRNIESESELPIQNPLILNCNTRIKQADKGQPSIMSNPPIDVGSSESTKEVANILETNNNNNNNNNNSNATDFKEPNLELSLKRLRVVQDTGKSIQYDRYVLQRFEQSAFSRYNTLSNSLKPPDGTTGSSSIVDNSVGIAKRDHFHNSEKHPSSNPDDFSFKNTNFDGLNCGSTNVLDGLVDGNPKNYSLNGSGSGSHDGSNVPNGIDVRQTGNSGSGGDASGNGGGNGVDENKFARREAALKKFRQKRKERCFKKKVRYQNRKELAEQRPRVRGQFVKQTGPDSSNKSREE